MLTVKITPTPETRAALADLAATDLTPVIRASLISATSPAVARIRARISNMPSTTEHEGADSLRAALAGAVKRIIRTTARGIWISIALVPHGGKSNLGRAVEGVIPWHHPVYGGDTEVDQSPYPFFTGPVESSLAAVDYQLRAAIEARLAL